MTRDAKEKLIVTGLRGAAKVRSDMQLSRINPTCIWDICDKREQEVFFIKGGSFEGLYCATNQTIAICSERPPGRQVFTCAHELGHAFFNHGTRADLIDDFDRDRSDDPEEIIADSFAGHLLMPPHAIESEMNRRGWKASGLTAVQVYGLACQFGVGYRTMITHLCFALDLINIMQVKELKRSTPQVLRHALYPGFTGKHLALVDPQWNTSVTVDVAVGDAISFPPETKCAGKAVELQKETSAAAYFLAVSPGLSFTKSPDETSIGIRVSRTDYVGRSTFRHLEEEN